MHLIFVQKESDRIHTFDMQENLTKMSHLIISKVVTRVSLVKRIIYKIKKLQFD